MFQWFVDFVECLSKVIRGGGAVGVVELTWMIMNSTDKTLFMGHRHEFVSTAGSILFNDSQTSMNLTVGLVNDLLPSLDTTYQLSITNVSQVSALTGNCTCVINKVV